MHGSGAVLVEPSANSPFVIAVRRDAIAERVGAVISHVLGSRLPAAAAVILASTVIAACGSGSPSNSSSSDSSGSNSSQTQLQQEALNFARCMRSHGVSNFPDPTPNGGGFNVNVPGINPSSPAFKAAQSACRQLLPVKRPQSGPPSAHAYMRLLHWAGCMRAHGMSGLPDPRPDPPPTQSNLYGTLMGDGGVLGRDPDLDQRTLARVYALVDGMRRITKWPSQLGGCALRRTPTR
jgi:hypothetical protein